MKKLLIQRRVKSQVDKAHKRNQETHQEYEKKSMLGIINTIETNIEETIKDVDADEKQPKYYSFTKMHKDDPPLTNLMDFAVYKIEERKFYMRYP